MSQTGSSQTGLSPIPFPYLPSSFHSFIFFTFTHKVAGIHFLSSQLDLLHRDWTLAEDWAVNCRFCFWNFLWQSLLWLLQFPPFCLNLLGDILNNIPRLAFTSFPTRTFHHLTTAGPLPITDIGCLPRRSRRGPRAVLDPPR